MKVDFGMRKVEYEIERKAQAFGLKMILSFFALSLKPIFDLSGLYPGPL